MDNLSSHKKHAIRQPIRAVGAKLPFPPPYSPDLNPIEQVLAKLKHLMRNAAERSHKATWRRVGTLLDAFSASECSNYLANSEYGSALMSSESRGYIQRRNNCVPRRPGCVIPAKDGISCGRSARIASSDASLRWHDVE